MQDGRIRFHLPRDLWEPLLAACERDGMPKAAWIVKLLRERLGGKQARRGPSDSGAITVTEDFRPRRRNPIETDW